MLNRLVRSFVPALVLASLPVASFAGIAVGVSITLAPPPLPVYVQPEPPGADYIWTPGYWAWGDEGYYWVPGTWVLAPTPGLLWTPGYWGWVNGAYLWHAGYWGPRVGFYGGVNYGFGYTGVGFEGCYWRGGHVVYNRAVTNVAHINVTNVYTKTVVVNNYSHVSFNGGHGGIVARATPAQLSAEHDRHFDPTPMQRQHFDMAARDRDLRASVNNGRPHVAATERASSFSGHGVVAARAAGGAFHPVARDTAPRPGGPGAAHGSAAIERNDRPPQAHVGFPARPDMHTQPARPDMHATAVPRLETHSVPPRPESHAAPLSRPEFHAASPRPEMHASAPRPEMHAAPPRPELHPGGSGNGPRVARVEPEGRPGGGGQPHAQGPRPGGHEGGHGPDRPER